jgi:peptidoglycan/xylan/chitin deacetylase (PgdA/CDA1 family)
VLPEIGITAWRSLGGLALRGGPEAKLSILIFHRVLREPDPLLPDLPHAARFDWQMRIAKQCFNVLPLAYAVERLSAGALPPLALSITFDDGYADNFDVALPLLQQHGLAATFFVATGFLDGGRMFNDSIIETVRRASGDGLDLQRLGLGYLPTRTTAERLDAINRIIEGVRYRPLEERDDAVAAIAEQSGTALPDDLMMSSAQVRALHAAGMALGGHTANHPILARLPLARAREEIETGRDFLEGLIRQRVRLFAYPNGRPHTDYLPEHVTLVRRLGFSAAVSTAWGAAGNASDPHQLPRFTPWDRSAWRFLMRMARNAMRPAEALRVPAH